MDPKFGNPVQRLLPRASGSGPLHDSREQGREGTSMGMSIGSSRGFSAPVSRPVAQPAPPPPAPQAASANSDVAALLQSGLGAQVNKTV